MLIENEDSLKSWILKTGQKNGCVSRKRGFTEIYIFKTEQKCSGLARKIQILDTCTDTDTNADTGADTRYRQIQIQMHMQAGSMHCLRRHVPSFRSDRCTAKTKSITLKRKLDLDIDIGKDADTSRQYALSRLHVRSFRSDHYATNTKSDTLKR